MSMTEFDYYVGIYVRVAKAVSNSGGYVLHTAQMFRADSLLIYHLVFSSL